MQFCVGMYQHISGEVVAMTTLAEVMHDLQWPRGSHACCRTVVQYCFDMIQFECCYFGDFTPNTEGRTIGSSGSNCGSERMN